MNIQSNSRYHEVRQAMILGDSLVAFEEDLDCLLQVGHLRYSVIPSRRSGAFAG
jgi:hypothetical protein